MKAFFFISSLLEFKILTLKMHSEVIHCVLCSSVLGTAGVIQCAGHCWGACFPGCASPVVKCPFGYKIHIQKPLPCGHKAIGREPTMKCLITVAQSRWHGSQRRLSTRVNFCHFVFYCGTEFLFFWFFFSFTSNILSGRGDIAHKYHKSTTYYFHWKLIFYIRYDWIGWNDAGLEDIIPYTAADRHKHHSEQERGVSCFSTAGAQDCALPAVRVRKSKTPNRGWGEGSWAVTSPGLLRQELHACVRRSQFLAVVVFLPFQFLMLPLKWIHKVTVFCFVSK